MITISARSLDSAVKAAVGTGAQHVTIAADHAGMVIGAAGPHSAVEVVLPTTVDELPTTHVPAPLLATVTALLPDGDVALTRLEGRLQLVAGRSRFALPVLVDAPQQAIPPTTSDGQTVVGADALRRAVTRAAVASQRNSPLPVLAGMQVKTSTGGTTFTATDRYRAAIANVTCDTSAEWEAVPMAEAMQRAVRDLDGEVTLSLDKGLLLLSDARRRVGLRLVAGEGEYPPVARVVPAEGMVRCTVRAQAADLLAAARRAGAVGEGRVLLTPVAGELLLTGQDEFAEAEDAAKADVDGEHVAVQCNAHYLADALAGAGEVRVRLTANSRGGNGPIVIDDDTGTWLHLVMPLVE